MTRSGKPAIGIAGLVMLPFLASCSQGTAQTAEQLAAVEVKAEQLAPGVAVLFGAGGNIGVSHGPDGTVLVDDQFAPLTPKIQAAVQSLGAAPVKYLVNTHWHYDHSGGNENFGKAGALIMAHDNVRTRMAAGATTAGRAVPPAPPVALPVVTYGQTATLHLNGDTIRLIHMPHGHTDGDTVLIWEKANIVHMGDLFMNKVSLPFVDIASGGNVLGFLAAAEDVLARTNDATRIIPGHGPMATRADLMAFREMLVSVIDAVRKGRAEGKTLAAIQAEKPAARWENPQGFIKGDAFVEAVWRSLEAPAR